MGGDNALRRIGADKLPQKKRGCITSILMIHPLFILIVPHQAYERSPLSMMTITLQASGFTYRSQVSGSSSCFGLTDPVGLACNVGSPGKNGPRSTFPSYLPLLGAFG